MKVVQCLNCSLHFGAASIEPQFGQRQISYCLIAEVCTEARGDKDLAVYVFLLLLMCRSPQFSQLVVQVFDRRGTRSINFDDFIQACVMLKTFTDKFRNKDTQQRGIINISYEDVSGMSAAKKP